MNQPILHNFGNGLILRNATRADEEELVHFNAEIHSDEGPEKPDERIGVWTSDLLSGTHPTFQPADFLVVEDTRRKAIVSSSCLISQTWTYAGVPFGVGRPELVGTLPDYRRRGLVRAQMDVLHRWSQERGELVQAITGIPYYYRQFGYEMCVNLGGGRVGYKPQVPALIEGQEEPYHIRPAALPDVPFLTDLYAQASQRYLLASVWDNETWRYEITGKSEKNINRFEVQILETPAGEPVGFFAHPPFNWKTSLPAVLFELKPGSSWMAVTPTVVRYLWKTGQEFAARDQGELASFSFWLGSDHPVYHVISDRLPVSRPSYVYYMRVADLPGFIQRIGPVLEQRLANSLISGYSGELKISFYRGGLHLVFSEGCLASAKAWQEAPGETATAAFPELTFLQLLFGYRSIDELKYAFADCWVNEDLARPVLEALFPKENSDVFPIS